MNTLHQTILENKHNNLSVFFTAGFPTLDSTQEILGILNNTAVDFIEIGIPFSDPLADGPVIQHSSTVALNNGMTLELLFSQLKEIRNSVNKPYLLMGYLNSLLACGIEAFYRKCHEAGVKHDEMNEVFMIANLVGGSIVIPHYRRAVEYWDELNEA